MAHFDGANVHEDEDKAYEGGQYEIDKAKERKLVRKLDLYIIPVVMLLYLLSFLDRFVSARPNASLTIR